MALPKCPCSAYQTVSHRQKRPMTQRTRQLSGLSIRARGSRKSERRLTQFSAPKLEIAPSKRCRRQPISSIGRTCAFKPRGILACSAPKIEYRFASVKEAFSLTPEQLPLHPADGGTAPQFVVDGGQ